MLDRDRMLAELTTAMETHHARRRARRRAAGAVALAAVAASAAVITVPRAEPPPAAGASIVQVWRNAPRTGLVRTIGDAELIDRLAEIDSPTGLIRTEGRVWLTDPPV